MHGIPTAGRNPFSVSFGWFLFWLFVLVFGSFLVCVVFDGIAHWTLYWSTTSSFEAADSIDGLASNYNSACLLRLNVCNDLAKAMKALDGKNRDVLVETHVNKLLKDKSFGQLKVKAYTCIAVITSCFIGDDCALVMFRFSDYHGPWVSLLKSSVWHAPKVLHQGSVPCDRPLRAMGLLMQRSRPGNTAYVTSG